jgi:hypothetical protein
MSDWLSLIVPTFLLTVMSFVCLIVLRIIYRNLRFNFAMKSLARELALNYTQPVISRPPTVNGFYRGREVVVDTMDNIPELKNGDCTRVRVFHRGSVENDFTVEKSGAVGQGKSTSLSKSLSLKPGFEGKFDVRGQDIAKMRKYLDVELQDKILAADLPFKVTRYCVSIVTQGRFIDRKKILKELDFLVEAATKADRL